MKKRVVKVIGVFGVSLSIFGLVGCSRPSIEPPKTYKAQVVKNDLSEDSHKYILKHLLNKQKVPWYITRKDNCFKLDTKVKDFSETFYNHYKNCFRVKLNYIEREDLSSCKSIMVTRDFHVYKNKIECIYDDTQKTKNYVTFLNILQNNLTKEYNKIILKYKNSLPEYNERLKKVKEIKKNLKIKFVDKTGLIPEKIKKVIIKKYKIHTNTLDRLGMIFFKKEDFFRAYIGGLYSITNTYQNGRYLFEFNLKKSVISCNLDTCTDSLTLYPHKLKYDFVPRKFIVKDKNLKVVAINKETDGCGEGKSHLESLHFTNQTTKFLKITTVSIYYNNKVNNILLRQPISLSPMSTFTLKRDSQLEYIEKMIGSNFFYKSSQGIIGYKYLPVASKDMKVKYGLSIAYSLNNTEEKSLYKVEEMKYAK